MKLLHILPTTLLVLCLGAEAANARDAAFLAPNAAISKTGEESIAVEPKNEIDLGDTPVNIGRRTTIFFINHSAAPIEIASILTTGDANVRAEILSDDCTRQGKIAVESRCAVSVETTPLSSGDWTAEVLMTHKGPGRLARAKLKGKTGGSSSAEKRELGLELSAKDVRPVDFGEVDLGSDQAVRSALMVNDSNESIKILSIDVIAAENGLSRLEKGCLLDMELKPGESCPVTLVWVPKSRGMISTDLIIRHSGKRGFVVVPIRGKALGGGSDGKDGSTDTVITSKVVSGGTKSVSISPTAEELAGMIEDGQIAPVSADALKGNANFGGESDILKYVRLIGTVGNRGVFYVDGTTIIAAAEENITVRDKDVIVQDVTPRQAIIQYGGKKRMLFLESVSALTEKTKKANEPGEDSPLTDSGLPKPPDKAVVSKPVAVPTQVKK